MVAIDPTTQIRADGVRYTTGTGPDTPTVPAEGDTYLFTSGEWTFAAGGGGGSGAYPTGLPTGDASGDHRVPGFSIASAAALALVADRGYYSWWFTDSNITISALQTEVTTAAGTVLRIAVVALDGDTDWQPNATGLIGQTTVDPSTTGTKSATGLSWVCVAGLYATIVVSDGAPVLRTGRGTLGVGLPLSMTGSNPSASHGFQVGLGSSALSDPVTDYGNIGDSNYGHNHFVGFKFS